ncbi:galactonate dehydratase [Halocatena halophila]|uniref:galactonate dehydratase n=1 Tax=Halocatena halophila TaxID=2814576 RepID=UPI002ED07399
MNITGYDLYEVPPRWVFLVIRTDAGITGWGEPIVEGRAKTVSTAVKELMDGYLLGKDPLQIEDHWQAMYRNNFYRGGPILMSAIAGIDQALWDIKGKHHELPVYELLGGPCRDRVRVYQWVGGDRPAEIAGEAEQLVDAGYTAIKMDAVERMRQIDSPAAVHTASDRVEHVREAVGPEIDIVVDFRGRASTPMASRLIDAIEPFEPMFVEEPVLPEYNDNLDALSKTTTVPLATGERMYSRWDFKRLFDDRVIDVVQPDISHAGGITEVRKIAAMAHPYDVSVALNCPIGPIALAASLQVCASIPNLLIQDHGFGISGARTGIPYEYLADPTAFEFDDGFLELLSEPGLGIEIDESVVKAKAQQDIDWHNPVWRHEDGSIAEW